MPTYTVLPVEAFGRQLIESGDLDPVYIALSAVEWDEDRKKRWLVAYWLFYHPGAACYMSEQRGVYFWNHVKNAAMNVVVSPLGERWPRASERRHFRGEKCVRAVQSLRGQFERPEGLVDFLAEAAPNYQALYNRACSLPQVGPWLSFKIADMLERCMGIHVDFDLHSVTMFEDPRKSALMVARSKMGLTSNVRFKNEAQVIREVVEHLIGEYKDLTAPPLHDRAIGLQETETVLCKWKAHVNGHYPIGKDTREYRHGLEDWARVCEGAREFLFGMPKLAGRVEQEAERA